MSHLRTFLAALLCVAFGQVLVAQPAGSIVFPSLMHAGDRAPAVSISSGPEQEVLQARASQEAPRQVVEITKGMTGDSPCSIDAVPTIDTLDAKASEMAKVNGFSAPLKVGRSPVGREGAGKAAFGLSDARDSDGDYSVAVVQVPYSLAGEWFGDLNRLIASSRCVWVVTVDAPFTVKHGPPGAKLPTLPKYSTIIDVASGQSIGVSAGAGAPDVIRGTNLAK